jgi:succinyl-CoA synthetase beta subunit
MEGTNVEEGKKLLEKSKLPIITAEGLTEAAEKVCAVLKGKG